MFDTNRSGLSRREFLAAASSVALVSASGFPLTAQAQTGPEPRAAAEFVDSVGVASHFGHRDTPYPANFDVLASELKALGIRHVRDEATVGATQSVNTPQFEKLRTLADAGFHLNLICFDPTNEYVYTPPSLVGAIAQACGNGVIMFEGGNEPNLLKNPQKNPLVSGEHQRELFQAVRADPSLSKVIVAGPSYIQGNVAIAPNLSQFCDRSNIHAYAGMEHPETMGPGALSNFVNASKRVFGDKPVVVTEIGYHTAVQTQSAHLPVSEGIKARYLPRTLLWCFLNGIRRTYIYELVSSFNNGPTDPESSFGLLAHDLSRTAAFKAIKGLMDLCLAGATSTGAKPAPGFHFAAPDNDRCQVLLSRPDGSHLLAVWLGISGWQNKTRQPIDPQKRPAILIMDGTPKRLVAHRFGDDGIVSTTSLAGSQTGYPVTVSDQLTVIEIS